MSTYNRKFDLQQVTEAVKQVESWRALAIHLDLPYPSSVVYRRLRPFCNQYQIDCSHFKGQSINSGKTFPDQRVNINDYLNNERYIGTHMLKLKLLEEGLKKHVCEKCGHSQWNDLPIPIQLHHVDGNSTNNNLTNLQILCPNCHAQTDTYCGKNQSRVRHSSKTSDEELLSQIPLWNNSAQVLRSLGLSLAQAHYNRIRRLMVLHPDISFKPMEDKPVPFGYRITTSGFVRVKGDPNWRTNPKLNQRKVVRPTKEELELLIWQKPLLQLGLSYGISDNAVRQWCKRYDILDKLPPARYWPRRRKGWTHEEALEPLRIKIPRDKLSKSQIIEILSLLKEDSLSQRDIASRYGVTHSVISRIKTGRSHRHISR